MATLGDILRNAREKKRVTASDAAAATRIKVQIISALEANDFSPFSAPIYGKGFIRMYAEYLGLAPEPLIAEYLAHVQGPAAVEEEDDERAEVRAAHERDLADLVPGADSVASRLKKGFAVLFRRESLRTGIERIGAYVAEAPWKCLWVGLGIVIVTLFVISAMSQCVRTTLRAANRTAVAVHKSASPAGKASVPAGKTAPRK